MRRLAGSLLCAVGLCVVAPATVFGASFCDKANKPIGVSASNLAFGLYSPGSAIPTTSNGTVTVGCVNSGDILPAFSISLSAGAAGSFAPRKMINGSAGLTYNIFTTAGYVTTWGNGTSGTATRDYAGNQGASQLSFTAFGRIPAAQFVKAASYTDTITVSVAF